MAVDVTQLAASLRLTDGTEAPAEPILSILTRLLGVSEAFVELRAPGCPPAAREEAIVSMASYMYDRPKAAAERRYADAWANSGAAFIVAPWVVQRLGDATGEALPPSSGGGLSDAERARLLPDNAADGQVAVYQDASGQWIAEDVSEGEGGGTEDAVARAAAAAAAQDVIDHDSAGDAHEDIRDAATAAQTDIDDHEANHPGGETPTPTPATPTPPTVLVDAAAYAAHGDVTVAGWRDYDFAQLYYAVGGNTYMTPPVNTVQLIAFTSLIVPIGRNVEWTLSIDAVDADVINTAQSSSGNAVAAPTATSTMTMIDSLVKSLCRLNYRTNVPTPGYNIQSLFRTLPQHTVARRCAKSLELPQNGFLRGNHDCMAGRLI